VSESPKKQLYSGMGAKIVYAAGHGVGAKGRTQPGTLSEEITTGENININGDFASLFENRTPVLTPDTIVISHNGNTRSVGTGKNNNEDFYIDDDCSIIANINISSGDVLTIIVLEALLPNTETKG